MVFFGQDLVLLLAHFPNKIVFFSEKKTSFYSLILLVAIGYVYSLLGNVYPQKKKSLLFAG